MMSFTIDVADCLTADDVYRQLLAILDAPDWHGHNLDALWDSITSDINGLSPPYSIEITGHEHAAVIVCDLVARIQDVFEDARNEENIPVELHLD